MVRLSKKQKDAVVSDEACEAGASLVAARESISTKKQFDGSTKQHHSQRETPRAKQSRKRKLTNAPAQGMDFEILHERDVGPAYFALSCVTRHTYARKIGLCHSSLGSSGDSATQLREIELSIICCFLAMKSSHGTTASAYRQHCSCPTGARLLKAWIQHGSSVCRF